MLYALSAIIVSYPTLAIQQFKDYVRARHQWSGDFFARKDFDPVLNEPPLIRQVPYHPTITKLRTPEEK